MRVKVHIVVDMRQGNNIQLSVQLLGCILIAIRAKVEQKQRQRYLEFVNSTFPPLHWQHPRCHLGATLGLGEAKGRPYFPIPSHTSAVLWSQRCSFYHC